MNNLIFAAAVVLASATATFAVTYDLRRRMRAMESMLEMLVKRIRKISKD